MHEVGGEYEREERNLARKQRKEPEIDYWKDPFAGEYGGIVAENAAHEDDRQRQSLSR